MDLPSVFLCRRLHSAKYNLLWVSCNDHVLSWLLQQWLETTYSLNILEVLCQRSLRVDWWIPPSVCPAIRLFLSHLFCRHIVLLAHSLITWIICLTDTCFANYCQLFNLSNFRRGFLSCLSSQLCCYYLCWQVIKSLRTLKNYVVWSVNQVYVHGEWWFIITGSLGFYWITDSWNIGQFW